MQAAAQLTHDWRAAGMRISYTPEQEELRRELRSYFTKLITPRSLTLFPMRRSALLPSNTSPSVETQERKSIARTCSPRTVMLFWGPFARCRQIGSSLVLRAITRIGINHIIGVDICPALALGRLLASLKVTNLATAIGLSTRCPSSSRGIIESRWPRALCS